MKGKSLPVGDTERGLGLWPQSNALSRQTRLGDGGPGALILDFSGVLPAGSVLEAVDMGSLQVDEGYMVSISTDGA